MASGLPQALVTLLHACIGIVSVATRPTNGIRYCSHTEYCFYLWTNDAQVRVWRFPGWRHVAAHIVKTSYLFLTAVNGLEKHHVQTEDNTSLHCREFQSRCFFVVRTLVLAATGKTSHGEISTEWMKPTYAPGCFPRPTCLRWNTCTTSSDVIFTGHYCSTIHTVENINVAAGAAWQWVALVPTDDPMSFKSLYSWLWGGGTLITE